MSYGRNDHLHKPEDSCQADDDVKETVSQKLNQEKPKGLHFWAPFLKVPRLDNNYVFYYTEISILF